MESPCLPAYRGSLARSFNSMKKRCHFSKFLSTIKLYGLRGRLSGDSGAVIVDSIPFFGSLGPVRQVAADRKTQLIFIFVITERFYV